jgi:hypothetical protein
VAVFEFTHMFTEVTIGWALWCDVMSTVLHDEFTDEELAAKFKARATELGRHGLLTLTREALDTLISNKVDSDLDFQAETEFDASTTAVRQIMEASA